MITFGTVVLNAHHSISLNFNFHIFWRFFGMKNMLYTFELCLLILLAMSLSRASSSGEVMPVTMSRKHCYNVTKTLLAAKCKVNSIKCVLFSKQILQKLKFQEHEPL